MDGLLVGWISRNIIKNKGNKTMNELSELKKLLEESEKLSFSELLLYALSLGLNCGNCKDKECIIIKIKERIYYYSKNNSLRL
jgi:hypothetical protein